MKNLLLFTVFALITIGAMAQEKANHNTTRSNKSTGGIAELNTNANSDDAVKDSIRTAQDYNSSRSNKPTSIAADPDGDKEDFGKDNATTKGQDYNAARSNKPTSIAADPDGAVKDSIRTAQDYNAARSNKPRTRSNNNDIGDYDDDVVETLDPDSDDDGVEL